MIRHVPGIGLPLRLRRFARDPRGVSAVEFALIMPLLISLYLGGVELSHGLTIDRKVTAMTSAVGDLVAQAAAIDNAEMTDIFEAASAVMAPYASDPIRLVVSSVEIDEDGNATVAWSDGHNAAARSPGSTVTLPEALALPNTTLILAEGEYRYVPTVGQIITESVTMRDVFYLRPRVSAEVERTI